MLFNAQPPHKRSSENAYHRRFAHTKPASARSRFRQPRLRFGDARIRYRHQRRVLPAQIDVLRHGIHPANQQRNQRHRVLRTGAVYRAFAAKQPEHAGTARLAARLRALPFAADGRVQNRMVCVQGLPPEFCRIRLRANQKSTRAEQENQQPDVV